jgi:hypothetical protein
VFMQTGNTVRSFGRIPQPQTHTTPLLLSMPSTSGNQKSPFSLALSSFPLLSSDNFPVPTGTRCRSSFQHLPDRPDARRTDWVNFQTQIQTEIPIILKLHNKDYEKYVRTYSAPTLGLRQLPRLSVERIETLMSRSRLVFRKKYA